MLPRPSKIVTDYIMSLDNANCSLLVQFLTGHNYLLYHLYITGVSETKECRLCQDGSEYSWHYTLSVNHCFKV